VADSRSRRRLQALRKGIPKLKNDHPYGSRWRTWYNDACRLLTDLYGLDSAELNGFLEIRFEIGKAVLTAEERLRQLGKTLRSDEPMTIAQEHYFLERLSEADEYLLSLILPEG